MLSKKLMYGFLIQLFFCTVLLANTGNAQRKTLEEVKISVNITEKSLSQFFKLVESKTDFKFTFSDNLVDLKQKVTMYETNNSLYEILVLLSRESNLNFVQINNNIHVGIGNNIQPVEVKKQIDLTIIGEVIDENGDAIPGATISVPGTSIGTVTDIDGKYAITVPEGSTLVFSFIGFETKSIKVVDQSVINITMREDMSSLEEVVVVGYGTQKKNSVTGSITTIQAEEIVTTTNENVANMLAGKVAGLRVLQRTAEPGSFDTEFDIRGMGNPLIVIDGVITDANAFNRLDPNDIESLSVLKDAAAAAVYGVRAANGVVVVKSKRGYNGKTVFNYKATYGEQFPVNSLETMSAYQYMSMENDRVNLKDGVWGAGPFSEASLQEALDGETTDWYGAAINNSAPQMQHSLSATGGSEKVKYFMSLGYMEQKGFWKTNDLKYDKLTLRSNITAQLTDNLEAELFVNTMADEKNQPFLNAWEVFKGVYMQFPHFPLYANDNPDYLQVIPDLNHPLAVTNRDISGFRDIENRFTTATLALNYQVPGVKGLKARLMHNREYRTNKSSVFFKKRSLYSYDVENDFYNPNSTPDSNLTNSFSDRDFKTSQISLNYETVINDNHSLKMLALYEETETGYDNFSASRFFALDIPQLYSGVNDSRQSANSDANGIYKLANRGLVGRVNYDFKTKYIAEFSFRYDGSSQFYKDQQWGFFPAASLGWVMSDENFFTNSNSLSFINTFKLRASYGKLGDDSSSRFQYLGGFSYPGADRGGSNFGGNYITGVGFRDIPNRALTWFTAKTFNIGFDARIFNGKLNVEADYFSRKREGLLNHLSVVLPQTMGASSAQANLDSDETKGFDLILRHRNYIGDFNYYVNGNVSYTRTEFFEGTRFYNDSYDQWRNNTSGRYNDVMWGYKTNGVYQTRAEIFNGEHATQGGGQYWLFPGNSILEDWNGDGYANGYDSQVIGTGLKRGEGVAKPLVNFGLTLGGSWKGFDIDILFQGGAATYMKYEGQIADRRPWGRNSLEMYADRWQPVSIDDLEGSWIPGRFPASESGAWNIDSEHFIHDAAYVRLKSAEIGYTIPSSVTDKIGIDAFRLFANGYNILTWDTLDSWDPEKRGDLEYMAARTFNVGVNVQF